MRKRTICLILGIAFVAGFLLGNFQLSHTHARVETIGEPYFIKDPEYSNITWISSFANFATHHVDWEKYTIRIGDQK